MLRKDSECIKLRGLEIVDHLRGRIGGMGVSRFVVDFPGGGVKVKLLPDYIETIRTDGKRRTTTFRNYDGDTYAFVDVASHDGSK